MSQNYIMIIIIIWKEDLYNYISLLCSNPCEWGKVVTLSAMCSVFNVAIMVINYTAGGGYHEIYRTGTRGMSAHSRPPKYQFYVDIS